MQKLVFTNTLNTARTRGKPVLESIHKEVKSTERVQRGMQKSSEKDRVKELSRECTVQIQEKRTNGSSVTYNILSSLIVQVLGSFQYIERHSGLQMASENTLNLNYF